MRQTLQKIKTQYVQGKAYRVNLGYSKEPSQRDNCFEHQNTHLNSNCGISATL